jgi:ketosteroid isomerase-like protein
MLRIYRALGVGDAGAIAALFSREPGVLAIGTDPAEWWDGHETITSVFQAQMRDMGGGFPIEAAELQSFSEGDAGWAADRPRLTMPDGSEVSFRLTAVLRREDGDWRVVQWHSSFGVANEEALGKELTV